MAVGHRGVLRFLTIKDDDNVGLDDAKLEPAEAMDGLYDIFTSLPDDERSTDPALEHDHDLWQLEATCRVT